MEKNDKIQLEIGWFSIWRVVFVGLIIAFFYFTKDVLLAVLLSIVISSALDPFITFLEEHKIPRVLGALFVLIFLILLIAILLYIIIPIALTELNILITNLSNSDIPILGLEKMSEITSSFTESISRLAGMLFSGGTSLFDLVSKFLGGIALTISVFVLSFYLSVDRRGVEKFLRAILPPICEDEVLNVYFRTRLKIGKWLKGQIFLSLTVGVLVYIGLSLLGVKYSLVIAILAAVLELIPFVGPIVSGAIAVIVALSQSQIIAVYVLIFFVVVQKSESSFLTPVFMKLTTGLNPAVILIAIIAGGQMAGVIGLILAVPGAVLIQEVINHWSEIKMKRKAQIENPV
ncbi:AI-2E family transporter [Patescibacteria group bacterium]|nr:AI-2E family transporter [Patescibacteria group bacterium]